MPAPITSMSDSSIEIIQVDDSFYAVCDKCYWVTGYFHHREFVESLIVKHQTSRKHLTNMRSPNRFTA